MVQTNQLADWCVEKPVGWSNHVTVGWPDYIAVGMRGVECPAPRLKSASPSRLLTTGGTMSSVAGRIDVSSAIVRRVRLHTDPVATSATAKGMAAQNRNDRDERDDWL